MDQPVHYRVLPITPKLHYSDTPLMVALVNQTEMGNKRPVNKQAAPNQVLLRHRPPIAAVVAVVTIVAPREIAVCGHGKGTVRLRKITAPQAVTAIAVLRCH